MCQSSVVDTVAGFAACVHIINTIRSGAHLSNLYTYDKSPFESVNLFT